MPFEGWSEEEIERLKRAISPKLWEKIQKDAAFTNAGVSSRAEKDGGDVSSLLKMSDGAGALEYLTNDVDPVIAPILKQILAERPHGVDEIRSAIASAASGPSAEGPTGAKMDLHYWGAQSRGHYCMFVAAATGNYDKVNCITDMPLPGTLCD
jgi:hypothetical protein